VSRCIIRVYEGHRLPDWAIDPKLLAHEDVPWGSGTASRRVYTLDVQDSRFWLSDHDAHTTPLQSGVSNQDDAPASSPKEVA